jgi:integrase
MAKLTKNVVDKAELRDKPYFIWCSDLSGFGVRVFPSGKRVYYADYRSSEGTRHRMTIGPHGKLTTEEARKLALATLGGVLKGENPAEERRTRRGSLTVSQLCDDYFEAADKGLLIGRRGKPKKASSLAADRSMIEAHVKPLLGRKLVIDLKRSDVQKLVSSVIAGKTATDRPEKSGKLRGRIRRTGGPGSATRSVAALGAVLSWAVRQGIIETSPTHGVVTPAIGRRIRRLTADEFKAFGKALTAAEADPLFAWQAIAELRLLALTGCRPGEVANLKWTEIDIAASVLRLADTKTGPSIRPLGQAARDLISTIPKTNSEFVFPAKRLDERPFAGMKRAYRKLFAAAALEGVTPHVLRHSFASVGADLGFTDSTVGACLGHSGAGVTSRYIHQLDAVLIAAADKISSEVGRQMTNEGDKGA